MIPPEEMQRYGDRLLAYWQGREEEAGVSPEAASELRRQERERERDKEKQREREREREREKEREAAKRPPMQRAASHSPMDVDKAPASAASASSTPATSTAPTTPANNSPSKLGRSSSLPRRPPSTEGSAHGTTSRGSASGRPVVSFAGPGMRDSGVVGVGP